ncbi:MAG TPA: class I SAM-dependent methyltransferase [Solirubrobacteraceae bacterium]|nr:class I SAM-dependent methyltransferase [Solirubrobacteraceae bacterium]
MSDAFKAFEAEGWSERAGSFETLVARATAHAIEPLLDAAGVIAGTRVLEVGCGLGDLVAAAAARGAHATGTDLAEGMLEAARRRHPAIAFEPADAEALPFADGAFDATVAAFVINHMPDPERGVAELARVTRPGGRVALAMWGPFDRVALLGLPAQAAAAAGVPDDEGPGGPSSTRFTDAGELKRALGGLHEVELGELAFTLPVAGFDELWSGVLGGTVRTSRRLLAGGDAVREALARAAEQYRHGDGYALPMLVRVASGRR